MRFKDNSGNIGVHVKKGAKLEFTKTLEIEKSTFSINQCEGDDLIEFWSRHGGHFDMITSNDNKKSYNDKSSGKKKKADPKVLKKEVTLGGEIYNNMEPIRQRTRKILSVTKDGDRLEGHNAQFLKDLIKFHPTSEKKMNDFDFFTVGKNKDHVFSRCFMISHKNGDMEDFSIYKCIENIVEDKSQKA